MPFVMLHSIKNKTLWGKKVQYKTFENNFKCCTGELPPKMLQVHFPVQKSNSSTSMATCC